MPEPLPEPSPPGLGPPLDGQGALLLAAHNAARREHGLPELEGHAALMASAADHAAWMARTGHFTHLGADGSWLERARRVGYPSDDVGENIALGAKDAGQAVADWLTSPGHRANVLGDRPDFGGGMAEGADGRKYWCCAFGRRGAAAAPAVPARNRRVFWAFWLGLALTVLGWALFDVWLHDHPGPDGSVTISWSTALMGAAHPILIFAVGHVSGALVWGLAAHFWTTMPRPVVGDPNPTRPEPEPEPEPEPRGRG